MILAAGESRRFGSAKLLAPLEGRPLLQHAVDAANASRCDEVVVVVGHGADELLAAVRLGRARPVFNADHVMGQSTSLHAGLREAHGTDALVVVLGDQPRVTAALIDSVIDRQRETDAVAVMCASAGRRSPPTLIHRELWPELAKLTGDVGAREVLRDRADVVVLDVAGGLEDVDRPADLEGLGRYP